MNTQQVKRGVDYKSIVKRSDTYKSKWVFKIYYADLINGKKVWRNYPNYISEYFKTKRQAITELNTKSNGHTTLQGR